MPVIIVCQQKEEALFIQDLIIPVAQQEIQFGISIVTAL